MLFIRALQTWFAVHSCGSRKKQFLSTIIKMDEILKKLEEQDKKIDAIYVSVEKTRKYFLWTMIITIVTIILPIIALIVLIPWVVSTFSSMYGDLL